jgi:hypothetical protein
MEGEKEKFSGNSTQSNQRISHQLIYSLVPSITYTYRNNFVAAELQQRCEHTNSWIVYRHFEANNEYATYYTL